MLDPQFVRLLLTRRALVPSPGKLHRRASLKPATHFQSVFDRIAAPDRTYPTLCSGWSRACNVKTVDPSPSSTKDLRF